MQTTISTNRRNLLAGAAAVMVAGAVPALSDEYPDPTFAAIEAHKAAGAAFEAAVSRECRLEDELPKEGRQSEHMMGELTIVETDDPRWIEITKSWQETCNAVDELAWAFIEHPPATVAGAAALMAYIVDSPEGWFPDGFNPAVNRVLAGALVRTAGGAS